LLYGMAVKQGTDLVSAECAPADPPIY
jgi:hypothetical protein